MQREELIKHDGKSWGAMNWTERSAVTEADAEKAAEMRKQHDDRPWVGKALGDMTSSDWHVLAHGDPDLFRKLWAERQDTPRWAGKAAGDLTPDDWHELHYGDPKLYAKLRAEWDEANGR